MSETSEVVGLALDKLAARRTRREFFNNPVLWAESVLGVKLWSKQADVAMSVVENKNVAVKAGHEVGKALALDTPIATPSGWTTMGEIGVGDEVFDENGNPTTVVAVSDTWMTDTYRVTFDDGHSIVAAGQHEWNVHDLGSRRALFGRGEVSDWREHWDKTEVVDTATMAEVGVQNHLGQSRWRVPLAGALAGPDCDLPLGPYSLGAWLGDGTSMRAEMTVHPDDFEIIERLASEGNPFRRRYTSKYSWVAELNARGTRNAQSSRFAVALRDLGLLNNKHIPVAYLRSSYRQRLELLRGLMDTDGTVDKRGLVSFTSTKRLLAVQVRELVESLGWKCTLREGVAKIDGREVGPVYDLSFRSDVNPFHLHRKAVRWKPPAAQASRYTIRTIRSIEKVETVPTRCITVDSDSHLFLAGEGLIPTHNSFLAGLLICWWVDTRWDEPGGCFVVSTAPSTKQINAIVWREVRRFHQLHQKRFDAGLTPSPPVGYITSDAHWRLEGGIELGYGSKPPEAKEDTMSGIHARYVFAVGDEAVGLSESLIDDLGNITSNATSRRFIIMNPTNPLSYAASIFKKKIASWTPHTISVFDSPNFHGGEGLPVEVLESLVDQSYVDNKIDEWGEEYFDENTGVRLSKSPKFISRVMGDFAWDMGFTLIRVEDVATALDCEIEPSLETRPRLGVDFSRSKAGDKNTVYVWHDGRLRLVDEWNEPNAVRTAERVHEIAMGLGVSEVRGDGQGLGGPIMDLIAEKAEGRYLTIPIDSSFTSPDVTRWYNYRAFMYWNLKDMMSKGLVDIDVDDDDLQEQLLGIELKKRLTGRDNILLESKEEMRKRGIHSPDHADAAVYASCDLSWLTGAEYRTGDVVVLDPEELVSVGPDIDGPGWFM